MVVAVQLKTRQNHQKTERKSSDILIVYSYIYQIQQLNMEQRSIIVYVDKESMDKIINFTQELVYIRMISVQIEASNAKQWIIIRIINAKYYEENKIIRINDTIQLEKVLKKDQQNKCIEIITPNTSLKKMLEQNIICFGKNDEINQSISKLFYIKLQLPPIFSINDDVQVEILGYKFDLNARLWTKDNKNIKSQTTQNLGLLLPLLIQQSKKSVSFYQKKDWKNSQKFIEPFAFQIEINVRILSLNNLSYQIRPINAKNLSIFKVASFDLTKVTNQQFDESVKSLANELIAQWKQKRLTYQPEVISFAPQKIFNPHLFIKTSNKQKYFQFYCKGIYQYYHYGDQNFNDQGWGCAYRSLQTLLSWLNTQNHLKLPAMLTLTAIQQLIDRINIGSKQKLKGTREWIGATEVSWVVKKLTDLDCRILHISDGKNIIEQCQIFREHFEKVGSPIMYGGGEYAYSIVGINYSWKLGQCQFLILDPHYTGSDSLDKILQKKGLCWRKPDEMFKKGIFYNFCLPLI